ncbi:MAG: site-specific tyrosine recombinase XerD [Chloroflexi bacterium]|nr:site-specific tyrosine recombinase XerD [Chloroflexota bacterium]
MDEHIGHFLDFMSVEKGASGNTVSAYRNDLQQFDSFITSVRGNGKVRNWETVERDLIVDYLLTLRSRKADGKGYAEATVARKVAALKSFFQYLQAEGSIRGNPAEGLESPRVGRSLPKPLSVTEVDELLEQPMKRNTPEAKRDRAMLELLYATGLRVSELVSLNISDVNMTPPPYVKCLGKGAKERVVPIHEQAAVAVSAYLDEGRAPLVKSRKEDALFVNRRGERLTRQGFWLILKHYAAEAKIDSAVTPHTLRHSFATHMLRGGAPLRNVQELLGHANISTTQVYTQVANDHVREVYEKAHPRAR